ncbi:MAG: tetratricopeptide repeat protein [Pseudomonadota bacterium]
MDKRPFPAYKGDKPYIFVSYAHANADSVYPLMTALHERGVRIWYDEGIEPGSKWRDELSSAIENADKVLFLASKRSVTSPNCEREIDFALSLGVPVRVAYIEKVELPRALSFSLGSHQAVSASHYDSETFQEKVYDLLFEEQTTTLGSIARRRNHMAWAMPVVASLVAVLAAGYVFLRPTEPDIQSQPISILPSIEEPIKIAIRPLRNATGNEDLSWVGEGIASQLRDQLSSSRYAVVMSPVSVLAFLEGAEDEVEIAEKFKNAGIDYLVSGDIVGEKDELLATMRVTNLRAGIDVLSQTYADLSAAELVNAATRISLNVRQATKIPREETLQSLSADYVTENVAAYEAYIRGSQLFNQFEYEEAEGYIESAISLSPDFYIARYRLAQIYYATSRRDLAQAEINAIPDDADLDTRAKRYISAFDLYLSGEAEKAIEIYQSILSDFPYEIEAQQRLSQAYFDSYQEDLAIKTLQTLQLQEPDNPHVLGALGYQLTSVGRLEEARKILSVYVAEHPDVPNPWDLNGALDLRSARFEAAEANFLKALEVDPAFTPSKIGLARTQAFEGKLRQAAEGFRAIRDDPSLQPVSRIDAAFDLAYVLQALERPEEVAEALKSVRDLIVKEKVRAGLYWYVLARAAAASKQYDVAFDYLENGIKDTPASGVPTRFIHQRGILKVLLGDDIEDEIALLKEYRLPDDNPDRTEDKAINHLLGLRALASSDPDAAVDSLKSSVDSFGYEYGVYDIDYARALFASGKRRDALRVIEGARGMGESLLSGEIRLDLLQYQYEAIHVQAEFLREMSQDKKADALLQSVRNQR